MTQFFAKSLTLILHHSVLIIREQGGSEMTEKWRQLRQPGRLNTERHGQKRSHFLTVYFDRIFEKGFSKGAKMEFVDLLIFCSVYSSIVIYSLWMTIADRVESK